MAEPQLSVRSARAKELAHKLAKLERRTVAQVVECALEEYAAQQTGRMPASQFYRELNLRCAADIDLEAAIREGRKPHHGIDL